MSVNKKKIIVGALLIVAVLMAIFIVRSLGKTELPAVNDGQSLEHEGAAVSNPIMLTDAPDPDVVRVEDTYYMVSTSMHMMPGSPIMKSTDLVHWEIIGYPYDRLEENDAHNLRNGMNIYGKGSWANSLKVYNGKFYVLTASLDSGKTYLFSTEDPSGDWERTEFNEYLHDPALFFDDDGKAYIIYGVEDFSIKELTADYKAINPNGLNQVILTSGQPGMEGAHVYKINGKYYITAIWWEQGQIRRQYIYRSDQINGPYEGRLALSDTMGYKQNGVAQGGLVDTPDGSWYAMLFQDHDAVGRVPVLVPVKWEDDWPIYGEDGIVPLTFTAPGKSDMSTALTRSDEFLQLSAEENATSDQSLGPASRLSSGIEIAANGSFNSSIADWSGKDQAKIEVIIDPDSSDNNIALISNRRATYAGIEQNFTKRIEPGERYTASFKVKYTDGPDNKEFILTARKVSAGETSYQNLVRGTVNKNEWTEITGSFTLEDDPAFVYLFIETPWTEAPSQELDLMDFYVDDVSITSNPVSTAELAESMPNGSKLGLQWQWNHNPDHTRWSLTERQGFLRLTTGNPVTNIMEARNTLTQRAVGAYSSGWISVDTSHMLDGDYAGLAAFQEEYGFIGVTQEAGKQYLVMVDKGEEIAREALQQQQVYLKVDFDFMIDQATFFYSYNGRQWTEFGKKLKMSYTIPHFMGYRFALFNFATQQAGGYVDFDFFRFSSEATGAETPYQLSAYLKESKLAISKDKESGYELKLLLDDWPAELAIERIEAELIVSELFEVQDAQLNEANLPLAALTLERSEKGIKLQIAHIGSTEPLYVNQDGSKHVATISLKLTEELNGMKNEEIKVESVKLVGGEGKSIEADVSGAVTKAVYTPPATAIGKELGNHNPLVTYRFGADPYALVYEDRVYLYMTNDVLEYDESGNVKDNTYSSINKLGVISSDDLVNWTDHGEIHVAGGEGAAKWATQSWAPAAVHKVIDGEDKFFLYFANNASNIGVLTSDSPTGPWVDPIGKPLITRQTPGVADVTWLFDPAVFVDDDGQGYIYFGGGVPQGQDAMPNTARVMKLGDDMISVVGEADVIPAPYMFENSGINKVGNKYYYTYCTNFYSGTREPGSPPAGEIAHMVSDSPMGPWTYAGTILKNPVHFFNVGGNNHHVIFEFHDRHYIAYHAQTLSKAMGVEKGYRSTHLNEVVFNDDSIQTITADYKGVPQIKPLNPYVRVEAETIGWNAGIKTAANESVASGRAVTDIDDGDWIGISNVDFGSEGATSFTASVAAGSMSSIIELRLEDPEGKLIGELAVPANGEAGFVELTTAIEKVQGEHHLFLVFRGAAGSKLMELDYWTFN